MFEKIKTGKYDNNDPVWDSVSNGAKDLVAKMLTVNAEVRLSAEECLEHPWLRKQAAIMEALPDGAKPPPITAGAAVALASRDDKVTRIFSVRNQPNAPTAKENNILVAAAEEELANGGDDGADVGESGFDAASFL